MTDPVLEEAIRLHGRGWHIHWLHEKEKRPLENGWTTNAKKTLKELTDDYEIGHKNGVNYNVGVRLGDKLGGGYLACIDIDVRNPKFKEEAWAAANNFVKGNYGPQVLSGSGNGSRHIYGLTKEPCHEYTILKGKGKRGAEDYEGEVVLYSKGKQMVLPPSIHPSGNPYKWLQKDIDNLPIWESDDFQSPGSSQEYTPLQDWTPEKDIDITKLNLSKESQEKLNWEKGDGDRSGAIFEIAEEMAKKGINKNIPLTIFTDTSFPIGKTAYEHAKTRSRTKAANWLGRYPIKRAYERSDIIEAFEAEVMTEETDPEVQTKELVKEKSWKDKLRYKGTGENRKLTPCLFNTLSILENAVGKNVYVRNIFSLRDTYGLDTPWGGKKNEDVTDDDITNMKTWLSKTYGLEPNVSTLHEAIVEIATSNEYHPIHEYLEALPSWDRVPRIHGWFKNYFAGKGLDEYLNQVLRKFLVAMITRVYQPGYKFDWMLILEGNQDMGKSSFAEILAGRDWFVDELPELGKPDAALGLRGMWIVEMGELAILNKSELQIVKGFITRTVDRPRAPYGRRELKLERQTCFIGTTDKDEYLKDEAGNRRFIPVEVGRLNFKQLKKDRDLLFAEALEIYRFGLEKTLEIEGEAKIYLKQIHADKMVSDDSSVMLECLQNHEEKEGPEAMLKTQNLKLLDLFGVIGPLSRFKLNNGNMQLAGKALKRMGYQKKKIKGKVHWDKILPTLSPHLPIAEKP